MLKIPLGRQWFGKTVGAERETCSYKFYSFTSDISLSNPGQVTVVPGVMLALQNITYFNHRQCAFGEKNMI